MVCHLYSFLLNRSQVLDLAVMTLTHLPHLPLIIITLVVSPTPLPLNTNTIQTLYTHTVWPYHFLFFPNTALSFTTSAHCHQLKLPSPFFHPQNHILSSVLPEHLVTVLLPPSLTLEVCLYCYYSTFVMGCRMLNVLASKSYLLLTCKFFKDEEHEALQRTPPDFVLSWLSMNIYCRSRCVITCSSRPGSYERQHKATPTLDGPNGISPWIR